MTKDQLLQELFDFVQGNDPSASNIDEWDEKCASHGFDIIELLAELNDFLATESTRGEDDEEISGVH